MFFRSSPLASPYKAYLMASKIVVFPEPVGPVIRKIPLELKSSKSIEVLFAYELNDSKLSFSGRISCPPRLNC